MKAFLVRLGLVGSLGFVALEVRWEGVLWDVNSSRAIVARVMASETVMLGNCAVIREAIEKMMVSVGEGIFAEDWIIV